MRLFGLSFLIVVACAAISSASAQERLKVITSGHHLRDWRFKFCDTHGCVAKVVRCARGYHIIYGNRCVAKPSLHSLYVGSACPQR